MKISYGNGKTVFGPGVRIELTGDEVATAIDAWLVAQRVLISGPRTVMVNDDLCGHGEVYVDPSGFVVTPQDEKLSGRGPAVGAKLNDEQVKRLKDFVARHKNSNWRKGQALFNGLYAMNPVLADKIRSTAADPFYVDANIPAFWKAVKA